MLAAHGAVRAKARCFEETEVTEFSRFPTHPGWPRARASFRHRNCCLQCMKPLIASGHRGLTILEVLVVLMILLLLAAFLLPVNVGGKAKASRIQCVNNLKNIGLAMRIFARDHGGNLPMDLPVNQGGTRELANIPSQLWRQFLVLTNDLVTPKLLWCPDDTQRQPATTFDPSPTNRHAVVFAGNRHLSYFLGLNANEVQPQTILAGDRNLTTNGIPLGAGRHGLFAGTRLGFTDQIHKTAGNILLGDGSVQQVTSTRFTDQFRDALTDSGITTNLWLVP